MFIRRGTPSGLRIDVDRGAVLQERHVLDRQDLGDDALVAVASGELVAHGDLALLRDVDADQLVDAGGSSSPSSRSNTRTPMTVPDSPCGTFIEVSRTSRAFSPKIARSRRSSGVSSVSPFGVTLPTRMSPVVTSAPMRMMPRSSRSASSLVGDVRDVAGDLLGTQLGVAGVDLVLLDVDRGEDVFLHQALAQDDRVLVVVTLPRHERDEQVLAQRHLALVGAGTVGDRAADLDAVTGVDQRTLVDAGALVGAGNLRSGRWVGAVVVHHVSMRRPTRP
jgi:hypothetical protein